MLHLLSLGVIGGADGPTAIFVTGPSDHSLLLLYLIAINIVAFLLYGIDKWKAKRDAYRISEKTLLTVAILGGSIGAFAGMHYFHHKTRHWYFRYGIPLIIVVQLALAVFLGRLFA
ncbi:MAG: DUF1294 domain-containing protein [Oscillospiraceae bacterium]|nr:DUF1294 domain-containing protein [Oscillospiraceae bacterium]